jgi:hypothetical protein
MPKKPKRRKKDVHRQQERSAAWPETLLGGCGRSASWLREAFGGPESQELERMIARTVTGALPYIGDKNTEEPLAEVRADAEAWHLLKMIFDALSNRAMTLVESRGSAEWLWFLRRLRGQFNINSWQTTDPYIQALAEAVSIGRSRPANPLLNTQTFAFDVTPQVLTDLHWLRQIAISLYRLDTTLKRCAKGEPVEFRGRSLPQAIVDHKLDRLISIYDKRRQDAEQNLTSAIGVDVGGDLFPIVHQHNRIGGLLPYWAFTGPTRRAPIVELADPTPAVMLWYDLDRATALEHASTWTVEHVALIALLWACLLIMTRDPDRTQQQIAAPIQWGYFLTHRENLLIPALNEVAGWLPEHRGAALHAAPLPSRGEDVIATLEGIEPSLRPPMCGNPVHNAGEVVVVDLVGASARFRATLLRVPDGKEVNYYSDQFEKDVQAIIDASPWQPQGEIRKLIRRKIRRGGTPFTDIDAVAHQGNRLILIDCKSIAFTLAAMRGDYNAVLKLKKKVDEYAVKWQEKVGTINTERHLMPIPIAAKMKIGGCIVLPEVPYVTDTRWLARGLAGLRFVSSSGELASALGSSMYRKFGSRASHI